VGLWRPGPRSATGQPRRNGVSAAERIDTVVVQPIKSLAEYHLAGCGTYWPAPAFRPARASGRVRRMQAMSNTFGLIRALPGRLPRHRKPAESRTWRLCHPTSDRPSKRCALQEARLASCRRTFTPWSYGPFRTAEAGSSCRCHSYGGRVPALPCPMPCRGAAGILRIRGEPGSAHQAIDRRRNVFALDEQRACSALSLGDYSAPRPEPCRCASTALKGLEADLETELPGER
jgi:hypothetical protein